jgi:antitoxin MazE
MKTRVVRIGNSRGIRIPKPVLEQCELQDEVDMEVRGRELVIRSAHSVREGWEEAFRKMAYRRDDALIDRVGEPSTEWADKDWEW